MPRIALMQGNEAVAEGALAAGVRFYAGYPITPSSEVAEVMARRMPQVQGVFIQMEDEIASIMAIVGASLAGKKVLTATSGPGFSLMQEGLGYACMIEAPIVILDSMRYGPSTGMPTKVSQMDLMQSRWGTHGDHWLIVYSPSSVQESYDLTIRAVNMAEKYRTPVVILSDETISHLREPITIADVSPTVDRRLPAERAGYLPYKTDATLVPAIANVGTGFRTSFTGLVHSDTGFQTANGHVAEALITRLRDKLLSKLDDIIELEADRVEDADITFISFGITARGVAEAVDVLRTRGKKAGSLRLVTLFPFSDDRIRKAAGNAPTIVVPELNSGQLVLLIKRVFGDSRRIVPLNKVNGDLISPADILNFVAEEKL
ncbi:MAG: 2-oxoacid:acceptor oxidoreductase subunit alpha [Caldisericota bacterium]|nr:2-oxoacid:acceptor oxidoreductase subunit alpha [Caldisericota bacterium]